MSKKNKKDSYSIDDMANEKNKSMMMGIIEGNKGVVLVILGIVLFQFVTNILTWLLTFKLI